MWATHPTFINVVKEAWDTPISACKMLQLWKKLMAAKMGLVQLNKCKFSNISQRLIDCKGLQDSLQTNVQSSLLDQKLMAEEWCVYIEYRRLLANEEQF